MTFECALLLKDGRVDDVKEEEILLTSKESKNLMIIYDDIYNMSLYNHFLSRKSNSTPKLSQKGIREYNSAALFHECHGKIRME